MDNTEEVKEFGISADGLSGLEISDKPLPNGKAQRKDKGVEMIVDGETKTIAPFIFGYNKRGIEIANGLFVNVDEVKDAIIRTIYSNGENAKVFSKKTGKSLDMAAVDKIVKEAALEAGKVVVSNGYGGITTANSRSRVVEGAHNGSKVNSPTLLSKKGIQLPCGEYVSYEEIAKGLSEYVVGISKTQLMPQEPSQGEHKNDNYVIRVVNKYKSKLSTILYIIAVLIMLVTGFGKDIQTITIPQQFSELNYHIEKYDGVKLEIDGAVTDLPFKIGESTYAVDGMPFTEYGTGEGNRYIVGGEEFNAQNKFEGEYDITGFAITLPNGKVYYNEKFDNNKPANTNVESYKENLNDFIIEVLKKHPEISINDLNISIHFGSNTNNTRLGWISINDLLADSKYNLKYDGDLPNTYSGVIKNHTGRVITINTPDGIVHVPVKDNQFKTYDNGTIVCGTDKQLYVIESVVEEMITTGGVTKEQSNIVWKLSNCNYLAASLPVVAALVAMVAEKKKNEKEKRNPKFEKFESEEEYRKFLEEFQKQRLEYDSKSKFVRWIMQKKSYVQRLTDDQVIQIYSMIKTKYGIDAEIKIENGKFVVIKPDGVIEQIDSSIISEINKIGEDNPYVGRTK